MRRGLVLVLPLLRTLSAENRLMLADLERSECDRKRRYDDAVTSCTKSKRPGRQAYGE